MRIILNKLNRGAIIVTVCLVVSAISSQCVAQSEFSCIEAFLINKKIIKGIDEENLIEELNKIDFDYLDDMDCYTLGVFLLNNYYVDEAIECFNDISPNAFAGCNNQMNQCLSDYLIEDLDSLVQDSLSKIVDSVKNIFSTKTTVNATLFNPVLQEKCNVLRAIDQENRYEALEYLYKNEPVPQSLNDTIMIQDLFVYEEFLKIIEEYGYPFYGLVDSDLLILIMLHNKHARQYETDLIKLCRERKFDWKELMLILLRNLTIRRVINEPLYFIESYEKSVIFHENIFYALFNNLETLGLQAVIVWPKSDPNGLRVEQLLASHLSSTIKLKFSDTNQVKLEIIFPDKQ